MTIQQLIDKYIKYQYLNYETIIISQVISDLRQCQRIRKIKYKYHTPQCYICGTYLSKRIEKKNIKYTCGACGSMFGK